MTEPMGRADLQKAIEELQEKVKQLERDISLLRSKG